MLARGAWRCLGHYHRRGVVNSIILSHPSSRGYGTFGDGAGLPVRSPGEIYSYLVRKGRITRDPKQLNIISKLDTLYEQLHARDALLSKSSSSSSLHAGPAPRGFYLHGEPGCGKTFLMDLAFRCAPMRGKKRTHFNSFMLKEVHNALHHLRKEAGGDVADGLPVLAQRIAAETNFLCFDEFQVTDIADAMILRRLMDLLWEAGVVTFLTSNRPPDDLYKNGIQRESFLPFIAEVKVKTHVVALDSGLDYRVSGTNLATTYFSGADSHLAFADAFSKVTQDEPPARVEIDVMGGRKLVVPMAVGHTARFSFKEICGSAVSAADYQALLEHFDTVFLSGVPKLQAHDVNAVRRFILLIDELYQAKIRVVIEAEAAPQSLFDKSSVASDEAFAWDRCVSRLTEMGSTRYLDNARNKRNKLAGG